MFDLSISQKDLELVESLCAQTGKGFAQMLDDVNTAYARLRADEVEWEAELEERRLWEASLLDGLEDD